MINNSYLLGLFGGTSSTAFSTTTAAALAKSKAQPTPPWSTSVKAPDQSALLRAALGGRDLINEGAAQLDVKGASADYQKLFALYQGLETMNAMVGRAATKGVSALELSQLNRRFTEGMAEISCHPRPANPARPSSATVRSRSRVRSMKARRTS
ncbi:MAG: hypothetical protein EON96_09580 [Caulobacteraceae bacterium]|nr:MAG: hypothetical protein EON96_09580 [Caulobacteraceae bacterium]